MLGIAVLFFLALWGIVVFLATSLPLKTIENKPVAWICAFAGFMLTFGGWWLKWTIEGERAYQAGMEACKQAKITIYVPPQKWVEMVGGYEAWKELGYDYKSILYIPSEEKKRYPTILIFEGKEYKLSARKNKRILEYETEYSFNKYASLTSTLSYDLKTKIVLYKTVSFWGNGESNLTLPNILGIRNGYSRCIPDKNDHIKIKNFFYITRH